MATYTFDKIEYGGNTYVVSDSGALQLTGGQVTGPVTFGDSISVDEATMGDLIVNGSASFTNNIQANTINGVAVGSSPKFTDTNTEVSTLTLAAGSTAGTALTSGGKFTLTAGSKTVSFTMPTIPSVPSNIVNTITTTAGAHTAITSQKGNVSFNVPTTAAHVGAATSDHTHGNITNGGDITATAPTIASGDQIIINDHSASKITNGPTFDGSTTTTALTPKGTWESFAKSDTKNTAGSTDTSSKIFLIGATSQAANPQTYSHDTAYVDTDGCLYSGGVQTLVKDYSAAEYTYLRFIPDVHASTTEGTDARLVLQASSNNTSTSTYRVMNYSFEASQFYISSQTLEKTFIRVMNHSDNSFGDNYLGIYNLRTPTADSDAATKKYVDDKRSQTTATLTTTWSSNQQTITVSGVTTSNTIVVTPAPASYDAYCEAGIYCSAQASNSLTFKCERVPSSSLTVNILILN